MPIPRPQQETLITVNLAARELELEYSEVVKLIEAGTLPAERSPSGGPYYISRKAVNDIRHARMQEEARKMERMIYPQAAAQALGVPEMSPLALVANGYLPDTRRDRGEFCWTQEEIDEAKGRLETRTSSTKRVPVPTIFKAEQIKDEYRQEWENPTGAVLTLEEAVAWCKSKKRGELSREFRVNTLRDYSYPGGTWSLPKRRAPDGVQVFYESDLQILLEGYKRKKPKSTRTSEPEPEETPVSENIMLAQTPTPVVHIDPYADLPEEVRRHIDILAYLARTQGITSIVEARPVTIRMNPTLIVPLDFDFNRFFQVYEVWAYRKGVKVLFQVVHVEDGSEAGTYKSASIEETTEE